ncbi:MAG TPA: PAS domain-containing sensor histidine kinase [Longimicrobiaceae bacterium]|nr:PAS domain-containing sensor histidine kinase [Longimicrobiaceae bacterium]
MSGILPLPRPSPPPAPGTAELYRLLVENVTDYAIVMLDPEGRVASWNEGAERTFGYREAEVLGRHASIFYPPEETEARRPQAELAAALREGRHESVAWRVRSDGSRLWGSVVLTAVIDDWGRLVGIGQITRDLTERKQVAQQYEESRQRLRSLFQYNPAAVCSFDLTGRLASANPAAEAMCGRSEGALLRSSILALVAPEDAATAVDCFRRAAAGEPQHVELGIRHRDGGRVEASATVFPIVVEGEILGVYAIAQDITGRKRAEAEREVLLRAERAARAEAEAASRAKSDFLAVVSHELRTPLNVITGYTDLLCDGEAGDLAPAQQRPLGRIRDTARQLAGTVDQVLAFARMEAGRDEALAAPLDLSELLREEGAAAGTAARERGLEFVLDLPRGPWTCRTDGAKARQLVGSLLSNAVKFTERGTVRLSAAREPDGSVAIAVSDTGVGIRPEHLERVWEPFWQAEEPLTRRADGVGLGLGVARRLAALLGWEVRVESVHGEGSTFTVLLPPEAGGPA